MNLCKECLAKEIQRASYAIDDPTAIHDPALKLEFARFVHEESGRVLQAMAHGVLGVASRILGLPDRSDR